MKKSKWLVLEDRRKIEKMYTEGASVQDIADSLNRNRTTIYKEIRKGDTGKMDLNGRQGYSAEIAQKNAYETKQRARGLA